MLKDTIWDLNVPAKQNVFNWVIDSFEPFIVNGGIMEFVKGRESSRKGSSNHSTGVAVCAGILRLSQAADEATALRYYRMLKYWHETDDITSILTHMPITPPHTVAALRFNAEYSLPAVLS